MGVSTHLRPGYGERQRVKIMTVDTRSRIVQGVLKDGSPAHIVVWEVPAAFRWPVENEEWIIRRDNGYWHLDRRVQRELDQTRQPLTALSPGQMRLDASVIFDDQGRRLLTTAGVIEHLALTAPPRSHAPLTHPSLGFRGDLVAVRVRDGSTLTSLSL